MMLKQILSSSTIKECVKNNVEKIHVDVGI